MRPRVHTTGLAKNIRVSINVFTVDRYVLGTFFSCGPWFLRTTALIQHANKVNSGFIQLAGRNHRTLKETTITNLLQYSNE